MCPFNYNFLKMRIYQDIIIENTKNNRALLTKYGFKCNDGASISELVDKEALVISFKYNKLIVFRPNSLNAVRYTIWMIWDYVSHPDPWFFQNCTNPDKWLDHISKTKKLIPFI